MRRCACLIHSCALLQASFISWSRSSTLGTVVLFSSHVVLGSLPMSNLNGELSLLHWAMSCARTGQLGVGPPNCLVAYCSSVVGIARPTGCFVPIVRPSVDDMLTICFA